MAATTAMQGGKQGAARRQGWLSKMGVKSAALVFLSPCHASAFLCHNSPDLVASSNNTTPFIPHFPRQQRLTEYI